MKYYVNLLGTIIKKADANQILIQELYEVEADCLKRIELKLPLTIQKREIHPIINKQKFFCSLDLGVKHFANPLGLIVAYGPNESKCNSELFLSELDDDGVEIFKKHLDNFSRIELPN